MTIRERMMEGNRRYRAGSDETRWLDTAENGQHPWAIVVCCSDSRVIPEKIFDVGLGDLFVIRVAGNVLDRHQLGSIEYAAGHLDCSGIPAAAPFRRPCTAAGTVSSATSRMISWRRSARNATRTGHAF